MNWIVPPVLSLGPFSQLPLGDGFALNVNNPFRGIVDLTTEILAFFDLSLE